MSEQQLIRVFVKGRDKKPRLELAKDGRILAFISEPKEDGRANEQIRTMLAEELNVDLKKIKLTGGHTNQAKVFKVL